MGFKLKKSVIYKKDIYNRGDEARMPEDLKEIMRTRLSNLIEADREIPESGKNIAEEPVVKTRKPRKPKKEKE